MIEESIQSLLKSYDEILYGFTSISYSEFISEYKSALVFAVPYGAQLTLDDYKEERFEKGIKEAKIQLEKILVELEAILKKYGVKYYIPPIVQNNEEELVAPFSFKYAAVNAGLGWIGKNDVVVTERYGPRIRLSAILIDMEFTYSHSITESKCPSLCMKCIDACPYNALHNKIWDINTMRNEIINYHLCNQKRSLFIKKHGRKSACGLCIAACPFGT